MKTIDELRKMRWPECFLSSFPNLPTTECINNTIVGGLMMVKIKSDVHALKFCDVMDELVNSKSSKSCIEILRKGN